MQCFIGVVVAANQLLGQLSGFLPSSFRLRLLSLASARADASLNRRASEESELVSFAFPTVLASVSVAVEDIVGVWLTWVPDTLELEFGDMVVLIELTKI